MSRGTSDSRSWHYALLLSGQVDHLHLSPVEHLPQLCHALDELGVIGQGRVRISSPGWGCNQYWVVYDDDAADARKELAKKSKLFDNNIPVLLNYGGCNTTA
jgi:hypothetical protein